MKNLILFIVLAVFLAGCATATPEPATVPVQPTATQVVPTAAASATAVLPTATGQPTAIPATSTPNARQQEQEVILPLVEPCNFADQDVSYSPNKTWAVVACLGDNPEDGITTKIVRRGGEKLWSLSFNELYLQPYRAGDSSMSALLENSFTPVRWTKNEDFVYLAIKTSHEETPYKSYDGLLRIDLSTGNIRTVLKPAVYPLATTYDFKFSPNGNKLAYINQSVGPITLVMIDTGSGEESRITLDARFTRAGGLVWSQDEKQLVVVALDEGVNGGNAVILYDLETMENTYLVQQAEKIYQPLSWNDRTLIYAKVVSEGWVYLDLVAGEISPAPSPVP